MIFVTKKLDCSDDLNKAIEMCEFLGGEIYEKHPSSITFLVEDKSLEMRGFKFDYTENRYEYESKRLCSIKKPHVIYTDCSKGTQTILEPNGKGHQHNYNKLSVTLAVDSWYEGISSDIIDLIKKQANDYGVKLRDVYFSLRFPSLSYGKDINNKKFIEYFKNVDQNLFSENEYNEWLNYNDSKLSTTCAEESECQDCDCEGGNENSEVIMCSGCSGVFQCPGCTGDPEMPNQVDSNNYDYCRPYLG